MLQISNNYHFGDEKLLKQAGINFWKIFHYILVELSIVCYIYIIIKTRISHSNNQVIRKQLKPIE